jgi:hypothetical protein
MTETNISTLYLLNYELVIKQSKLKEEYTDEMK